MNYINNLYLTEDEYTDNCSLFNFQKKDDNYINLSSQKNFANIDLNKNLDNNFGSIMIPNTEKKTIETELKKKFKNNLIFKINQIFNFYFFSTLWNSKNLYSKSFSTILLAIASLI